MASALEIIGTNTASTLVVMPLTRVLVEERIQIGGLTIFPPGELDLNEIHPDNNSDSSQSTLRDAVSSVTGFSLEILQSSVCVCFLSNVDWNALDLASHIDDRVLLNRLSSETERAFDVLRFHLCRLDLPDTLPGVVGAWSETSWFIGALLYARDLGHSRLIGSATTSYTAICCGIGLDMSDVHFPDIPNPSDGEVSALAVHALTLLSDAMHARNDTSKFVRTMTLLEFLGSPDEYKQWQKLKGDIVCHRAQNKSEYLEQLQQLRQYTSLEDEEGFQIGYRTLLVHHGKFLEDILPSVKDRQKLFKELQFYCQCVIEDMLDNRDMSWSKFVQFREGLKRNLIE